MKVNGLDVNIGVEGVLVVENRASSVMSHVEPICKNVMIDILNRVLQGDDVPLACDLFLKSIFLPTQGSWIPVVDAESLLHRRTIRHILVEALRLRRYIMSPFRCLAKFCDGFLNIDHVSYKGSIRVCFHPRSGSVCA